MIPILIIGSLGFVATNLYLPSLPSIVRALETSQSQVQLTLSFYLFSFGASQLIYGPLSDQVGRKQVVLSGILITVFGTLVCFFAPWIEVLVAGRFVEGVGVGACAVGTRAILRDVYSGDTLAQKGSYVAVGTGVFMALAPILGGYIQKGWGWRANFGFIALYSLLCMLIVFFLLYETHRERDSKALRISNMKKKYGLLFKSRIFMSYAACGALSFSGLAAYLAVSPFLFQNVLGISAITYGWLALFIAIGLAGGGFVNGWLIPRFGRQSLLRIAAWLQLITAAGMVMFGLLGWLSVLLVMVPMLIYMFGAGVIFANSFAGAFHFFSKIAGFAGAAYGCLQILGGTVASAILSGSHAQNQVPLGLYLSPSSLLTLYFQRMGHQFTLKMDKKL